MPEVCPLAAGIELKMQYLRYKWSLPLLYRACGLSSPYQVQHFTNCLQAYAEHILKLDLLAKCKLNAEIRIQAQA